MNILYVTTVGSTMGFFIPFIELLLKQGDRVSIASNETETIPDVFRELNCPIHKIDCSRSPLSKGNVTAIRQIKKLVTKEHFDIVHCHTPVAAMCTRFACRKVRKTGTKVFYTAHGFHFYQGAPKKNWLLFYPIESLCSRWTDVLITINTEDFDFAKRKLHAKRKEYVPGVGFNRDKIQTTTISREQKRDELGIPQEATLLLSVGELNENKNHETVLHAIKDINVYYIIAGNGGKEQRLNAIATELGMSNRFQLLGRRNDVNELLVAADIFVFPSFREGLSVSLMEAMAAAKPVVASRIRGNVDLIDENGGSLFDPHSVRKCSEAVQQVIKQNWQELGKYNYKKVNNFSLEVVLPRMSEIYKEL